MFIEMKITSLTLDPLTEMPVLLLKDEAEKYSIPIWIGLNDASGIAAELEDIKPFQPTTHDLLQSIVKELGAKIRQVEITDIKENIYLGFLVLLRGKATMRVPARPSDAIALALRCRCPILVEKKVIKKAKEIDLRARSLSRPTDREELSSQTLASLPDETFGKWKM
jgi:uncharacterized protein